MTIRFFRLFSAAILFLSAAAAYADQEPAVVAEVNGVEINSAEVEHEMNMMYQRAVQYGVYPEDSETREFRDNALQTLIGRELLVQTAVEKGYNPDEEDVDDYINALTINYGGTEALEAALSEQGMTLDKLRSDTERYQIISKFIETEFRPLVHISEETATDYYDTNKQYFREEEKVRASHILVKLAQDAGKDEDAAALKKITSIREQLLAGADFAELAKEYSECPSAENGGDLGEFGHGAMVPPFDRAAFSLEPGELSEPVRTQFGYHLIKLTDKKGGGTIGFEQIKPQIMDYLADRELENKVNEYVENLRTEAKITIF